MKTKLILGSLALLNAVHAETVTVRFDDIDRAPADSLTFGPITITGNGMKVATVAGVGLGVVGFGSGGDTVRSYHYAANEISPDWIGDEHITFSGGEAVVRLIPLWDNFPQPFTILGIGDFSGYPNWAVDPAQVGVGDGSTFSNFTLSDRDSWWADTYWPGLRFGNSDLSQPDLVQFGFSIISMEYQVPEPSTWLLLVGGIGAVLMARRTK